MTLLVTDRPASAELPDIDAASSGRKATPARRATIVPGLNRFSTAQCPGRQPLTSSPRSDIYDLMPSRGGWHTRHWVEDRQTPIGTGATLGRMAAIVLAFCASHAPVTAVAGEPARVSHLAREPGLQACVALSTDCLTALRQENLPAICRAVR